MKRFFAVLAALMLCFCLPDSVFAFDTQLPELYAEAAVLMDASTGQVLYGKNEHQLMEPASLTKIMTCLLAARLEDPDTLLTVSEEAVKDMEESSTMDVVAGEILMMRELLYGLMLPSANDAANVIAEHFAGNNAAFAELMNDAAAEFGLYNTTFANPHGLPDEAHLSTAYDLAKLTREAIAEPAFLEYAGAAEYPIAETENHGAFELKHTLFSLQEKSKYYDERVIAGKTGWTPGAGTCLMTVAQQEELTLIAVVLKSDAEDIRYVAYQDVKALLDYGFSSFVRGEVSVGGFAGYPVSFQEEDGTLRRGTLYSEEMSFSPLIPEGCSSENIFLQIPQQEQFQKRAAIPVTASVTFRDAQGEVWPWALAEVPVTLELIEHPTVSYEAEERPAMAQPYEKEEREFPIAAALWVCVALLAGMVLMKRKFR